MNRKDQNLFDPIENPYIVGNPVKEPKMFFGREDDFSFIRQKVAGARKGGLLVLCGARRSGKTSILFQIMNGRLGEGYFPVLIDLQSITATNDREFLAALSTRIVDAADASGLSIESQFINRTPENPLDAFQSLVLEVVHQLAGQKLILLFDEYEIFETRIDKGYLSTTILDIFGSWLDHQQDIFIIFTGSEKVDERKRDYWGRFLPKAVYSKRISFLSRIDTIRLIEKPLEGIIRYEPGVPERIYELTAGQPFYTQVFCQVLVDRLNERSVYEVTSAELESAVDQIVENPLPQMIFSWNSLSDVERLILAITAELGRESTGSVSGQDIARFAQEKDIGLRIDTTILNESLEKLFHQDLLEKDSSGKAFAFRMALWRKWVAWMHSVWEITDEMKEAEGPLGEGIHLTARSRRRVGLVTAVSLVAVASLVAVFAYLKTRERVDTQAIPAPEPDSTRITIRTDPPGAEVIVSGRIIGRSPVEEQQVPVGPALLVVRLAGYKDYADSLDLRVGGESEWSITLVKKTGGLRLDTTPHGAEVLLDGQRLPETTPLFIDDLPTNELHHVRLTLNGYETAEFDNLKIVEDSVVTKHHTFELLEFLLTITTTPDAADVFVDGQYAGKTPNTAPVTYGTHQIEIKKGGYETMILSERVTREGQIIDVPLTKLAPGVLIIMVRPWADIYINGSLADRERTNYRTTLEPGTYRVRLINPHYESKEADIEVRSSAESVFEWDLKEKDER